MSEAVVGVYMIILMQKDLQAGMEFYKKLGLKTVFYIPGKWCELQAGGLKVGLCPAAEGVEGRHTGVVFQVKDVRTSYESLKAEGMVFLNEPTVATHGVMVTCADPSGNVFDLYQPTHDALKSALEGHNLCADSCGKSAGAQCCKPEKTTGGCC